MKRPGLNLERIVDAAIRVADDGGLAAVSMRNVGKELGVEAMSLYHHIAGKEPLLDAMVEWVFARIRLPDADAAWRAEMTSRAAKLVACFGLTTAGLGRIEILQMPNNLASQRVATKIGATFDGELRNRLLVRGTRSAVRLYSLTQADLDGALR